MLKNQTAVEFSSHLDMDSRSLWRLFVMDAGDKLRLNFSFPGDLPKDKVVNKLQTCRFDRYVPDHLRESGEWYWWIEKW